MKLKRIVCLLLGVLMLAGVFASCNNTQSVSDDTTAPAESTTADDTSAPADTTTSGETTSSGNDDPETVIPSFYHSEAWHYSAPVDEGKKILLACTVKTASFFESGGDLGGYPCNNLTFGSNDNKMALTSVNDDLLLTRFENTLYDYSYHIIYIDLPNDVRDTRENYLAGLKKIIDMCQRIQPGKPVVFVNTTVKGGEEDVQKLFEDNGCQYWNYYRGKRNDFLKQHKKLALSIPFSTRTEMLEGEIPAGQIPSYKEGLSFDITEVYYPTTPKLDKPRVLICGDSICYGYRDAVRQRMQDTAYVDAYVFSFAAADPSIIRGLTYLLQTYDYDVIHFNVAFHNSAMDMAEGGYAYYLEQILTTIQELAPNTKVVFATGTTSSSKNEAGVWEFNENTYGIWKDRRDAAVAVCEKLGITVDDLYTLCLEVNPAKGDDLHFADQTALSEQVAKYLTENLRK